ncbi:uncharacterized protein LDX57_012109 [Aspergillus melleus]|nr:uncharacterized protein LDX57_012109 [Aspergillus melleus]KAH8434463.1 hypothetical protein LDX57_012109 [Aspergillus melleus]
MLSASSPTMEILPVILQPVLAQNTGTVSPALVSRQSEGVQYEDAIVYTLFDPGNRLPISRSPEPQMDGLSREPSTTAPELDMDWCLNENALEQGTTVENYVVVSSLSTSTCVIEPNTEAMSTTPEEQENDRLVSRCQSDSGAQSGTTQTTNSKRTTSPTVRECIQHMINEFVAQERQKCTAKGLEPFVDEYLRPEIQHRLVSLGNKFLATLFLKIGGPQQIIALRGIACDERTENIGHSFLIDAELSIAERLRLIFALDVKVAGTQLSRWYHILELFKNCGGCEALSFSGNLHTTPATFGGPRQSRGNPIHKEDARVVKYMLHECFPDITADSSEFRSKLGRMKQIRKLGKRLHLLVGRFGEGILGLMFDLGTKNDTMATADSRLLDPTDRTFNNFVDLLDDSQGDILREASNSVRPLFLALSCGTLWFQQQFPLETIDTSKILGLAKGSPSLFQLIQYGENSLPM